MVFHMHYGYHLSDEEVLRLLSGEEVQYEYNGKKITLLPKCKQNEYNSKTMHIWESVFRAW